MAFSLFLKLIHVLAAVWMTTGIIGRYVAMQKAEESKNIHTVKALMSVAGVFERIMVIPGSFAVLVAGLITAWVQGWPILGFLQGGTVNWVLVSLILYLTLIPIIRFVFLPRGKVFEAALHDAIEKDQVTPELSQAFRDPIVRTAHYYEIAVVVIIFSLMVLKPF